MPFFVRPIVFPLDAWRDAQASGSHKSVCAAPHVFQQALRWQQEIAANPQLTKARNAVREGLSRSRLTQIMNLLQLPASIQQVLRNPPPPH